MDRLALDSARPTLASALTYLHNDWSIIPLRYQDKHPIGPWKQYQQTRATEEAATEWFQAGSANVGIVTGAISDLTVVDCDSLDAIALAESLGMPTTWTVQTGKGRHYYFRYQAGSRNFQKRDDLPGIDVRSEGGYVVAPPSLHPNGSPYQWLMNHGTLADLPAWVLASQPTHRTPLPLLYGKQPLGQRNHSLARLAGKWVKLGLDDALYIAQLWNMQHSPPLPWAEVTRTVQSIWEAEQRTQESRSRVWRGVLE